MPSLARSVPKPLKVPSLARSVPKPLKVPSLARSVPKPRVGEAGGLQTCHYHRCRPLPAGRRQRGNEYRLPKVNRRQRGTSTDSRKLSSAARDEYRLSKVNRRTRGYEYRLSKVNRRQRGTRYDSPKLIRS